MKLSVLEVAGFFASLRMTLDDRRGSGLPRPYITRTGRVRSSVLRVPIQGLEVNPVVGNMPTTASKMLALPSPTQRRIAWKARCEGERDHVGRTSRHVAGVHGTPDRHVAQNYGSAIDNRFPAWSISFDRNSCNDRSRPIL